MFNSGGRALQQYSGTKVPASAQTCEPWDGAPRTEHLSPVRALPMWLNSTMVLLQGRPPWVKNVSKAARVGRTRCERSAPRTWAGASALCNDMSHCTFKAPRAFGFWITQPRRGGPKSLWVTNYILVDGPYLLNVDSRCVRLVFGGYFLTYRFH